MRAARNEHVNVHLSSERSEHLSVASRHDLLPMSNTYPERLMRNRQGERVM